ncbi:MAG: polysulfide reductase NrfD [Candidatus Rokubacteria bacterium]|nr:polysulfide reductase NrfD [Candidatus Rokubacteria bacterium]
MNAVTWPRPALFSSWRWHLGVGLLVAVVIAALYALSGQIGTGLAVTGMNSPAYWGLYIVNFVFFVGLSAGGIIIASLVHAFGLHRFRPVARIAELMALACVILAVIFILLDMGRPDRLGNLFRHGQLQSPLVWDVAVVNLYLLVSLAYAYVTLRADLARLTAGPRHRWLYRLLTLGDVDLSPRALARDEKILQRLALAGLPLAVALHTVTAWILGLVKARPGWYGAIMAPLFIVSATVSGLALLLLSVVVCRRVLGLAIDERAVRDLGTLLVVSIPVLGYLLFAELLTVLYGREPAAFHVFHEMMRGEYAPVFWGNLFLGLIYPQLALAAILLGLRPARILWGGLLATPIVVFTAVRLWEETSAGLGSIVTGVLGSAVPPWLVYAVVWLAALSPLLLLLDQRTPADIRIGVVAGLVVLGVLAERWNIVITPLIGHAHLPSAYLPPFYAPTAPEMVVTAGVYALGALLFVLAARFLPLVALDLSPRPVGGGGA